MMISSSAESPSDRRRKDRWTRWAWLVVLLLVWEAIRRIGDVNPLLMPSLKDIVLEFVRGFTDGRLAIRWLRSLGVVAVGMATGILAALVAVLASRADRRLAELFNLLSSLMHPLPGLALLPLVILWFGTGMAAVTAVIIHAVLWPVFVNMESGIRSLPEAWILYSRNLGLSPLKRFFRVELPGSFPYLISGIRTGWARSWRAFIAAEMVFGAVGSGGGLGWQLFESRVMMDTPALYAALLAVMITGLAMEDLLLARWESSVRRRWGEI